MSEVEEMNKKKRAKKVMARLFNDFEYYAEKCLKILAKPDAHGIVKLSPFKFNAAQKYIHERIEEQNAKFGFVRAIILKGRQQGASTYTEGRFYWKTTTRKGQKTFIMTHEGKATDNLFGMVERYHKNTPVHVRPFVGKDNAKELVFSRIDSRYQVATAGSKGAGRSATLTNVHGSEVAFWEQAESHLSGMLQAVPLAKGTEIVLESTAQGIGNVFHRQWQQAVNGESDFIAIFVPWFWQTEYRRKLPDDFSLFTDPESTPEGEITEEEYAKFFKLDNEQMYWRRMKIAELGGGESGFYLFKEEYPATPDEAFQASQVGNSLNIRKHVLRARKNDVSTGGPLIIGVDPGGEGEGGDPTGIIRRRRRKMYNPQLITKLNTMQLAALVHKIIKLEKPTRVFIDVGGIGKGVYDRLMEMEGTHGIVEAVNFGSSADEPEEYVNKRAEMHWRMKDWLEDVGGANIPDDDAVQADFMASIIAPSDSNQRRQLRSKQWMKSKGLASPNLADAGALTFAYDVSQSSQIPSSFDTDFDAFSGQIEQYGSSLVDFDPTDGTW